MQANLTLSCAAVSLWTSPYIPDAAYIDLRWSDRPVNNRWVFFLQIHIKSLSLVVLSPDCWNSPSGTEFLSVTCLDPTYDCAKNFNLSLLDSYVFQPFPHHSRLVDLGLDRKEWPMSINVPSFLTFVRHLGRRVQSSGRPMYKRHKSCKVYTRRQQSCTPREQKQAL
jgi:hypothetical protein